MNNRLMKTEEEARQRAKELLQLPPEDLITQYMFQEQEIERLNNIIEEIRECVKHKIVECYDEGSTIGEFYKICDIDNKIEELLDKGDE